MPDFITVPTVELLTRAADAAGKAAAEAECDETTSWRHFASVIGKVFQRHPSAHLIAASGPDHWRAVEATFRTMLELHPHTTGDDGFRVCATCANLGEPDNWPCSTLDALRPLAEQVLQHLGDTP